VLSAEKNTPSMDMDVVSVIYNFLKPKFLKPKSDSGFHKKSKRRKSKSKDRKKSYKRKKSRSKSRTKRLSKI
jgi:hypothetical protein